ncbi:hypothetical protein LY78DRAFT_679281 [Colletotrichum sublineola]|uniref:Uncharacterized protein n=1 Tax=Colletotrichum sublineola TaxID=1173701 RepID=A0A066X5P6_COLSU|nr:hypothetical protein LY78DRAFT_679281 [Colletotrichum sublineola]KDN61066.1 hypothetical protein CSUB01_01831 [Colletotrichum sublineola]
MEGLSMKDARYLVEGAPPPPTLPAHGDGLDGDQPSRAEQAARADPDHPGVDTLGAIRWQLGRRITEEHPAQNVLGDEPAQIVLLNEEFEAYVLELNSRCINIYQFQDPKGKDKRAAGNERTNRAYFVGADSMTGRPVVADGLAKSNRGNPPRLDADFTGAAFVGHHTKTVATAPIPHTNMLRGRNQMTFVKRLTLGDRYPRDGPVMPVPARTELDTYLREEDEKWQLDWPLSVTTLDPTLAPSFQNLDPTGPNEWRYA